jgi:hypothetical protein
MGSPGLRFWHELRLFHRVYVRRSNQTVQFIASRLRMIITMLPCEVLRVDYQEVILDKRLLDEVLPFSFGQEFDLRHAASSERIEREIFPGHHDGASEHPAAREGEEHHGEYSG